MSKNQVIVAELNGQPTGMGFTREEAIQNSQARGFTSGSTRPASRAESRDFRAMNQRLLSPEDFASEARDLEEVRITREDASDAQSYRRAKEYSDRAGLPLVVIREGAGTAIPSKTAPLEINRADAEDAEIYRAARRIAHAKNADLVISNSAPRVSDPTPPAWHSAPSPVSIKRSELEDTALYRERRAEAEAAGIELTIEDA